MVKLSIRGILGQNKDVLIIIFIFFTTPWTWKILNDNVFLCLLLILITAIFVKLLLINKFCAILILILCCAFLVASVINLQLGFDQDFHKLNVNEKVQLDERHKYYARELGELFLNKYALNYYKNYNPFFYKFQRNVFSVLDPNLYFFASHPRERAGINEFEKFPSVYLFLFIFGILYILQKRQLIAVVTYLLVAVFISGFIAPAFILGPILLFPFISTIISLGLIYFLNIFLKIIH